MALELTVNSRPVDLGIDQGGALLLWGAGLNAIRAARAGSSEVRTPQGVPVEVIEILRNRKVIGHLALVRRIPAAEQYLAFDDLDPAREDEARLLRIALMRGQAELVVTTVDWVRREAPAGTDWLAVFKSADDFDEYYAEAEPPAHDNWVTEGSSSESSKIIRHTKTRVRQRITEAIHPEVEEQSPTSPTIARSTGALSRRLGAILPGPAPQVSDDSDRSGTGRRRTERRPRWTVEAGAPRLVRTAADGTQEQEVRFIVAGDGPVGRVRLSVSLLGDEGLHEPIAPQDLAIRWQHATPEGKDMAVVRTGEEAGVRFLGTPRRALRVEITAGASDGRS